MTISRRRFLRLAAGVAALPVFLRVARAQAYPTRPVRIIVGFAAGGANDIVARLIGQWLSERFGRPFIVENRPGANTNLAAEAAINAAPDGYTLLVATVSNAVSATLYDKLKFDFIRDTTPVASTTRGSYVMVVNPSIPVKTVAEFVAYTKTNQVTMASAGIGSGPHVAGELFKASADAKMVHVPYRGDAPAIIDLMSGQVQVYFSSLAGSIEYIRTGKLRALAVTTAARSEALPEIPALGEIVPGYEASQWSGVCAPKNTPAEIIDKLNAEINAALADSKIKARISGLGSTAFPRSPAEFGKFIVDETEKWSRVVKSAGIKPE
jgi:tripartite-type tricarboxylate transporter receptor subunit TctC